MKTKNVNKIYMLICVLCLSCTIFVSDKCQYWEDLSDTRQNAILQTLHVDVRILMLYQHQMTLSDDDGSEEILNTLCSQTDGYKKIFYFYVFNDMLQSSDGALREMMGTYCLRYVMDNPAFTMNYFSNHSGISKEYSSSIGTEIYHNNMDVDAFKHHLLSSIRQKSLQVYTKDFIREVLQVYDSM